ncbi:hypothetical protein [Domibacillus tundrae]|jgi:hypothetical protein|uniref:hypothetical protein n=1 Tax=Domibacillus tundrae TaxID=1587527 RepID=UPI000B0235F3|nr:hypothetical protein [Domibacillus tundrae]
MLPIEIFGWFLCALLAVSFIVSLIFLPKNSELDTKSDNTFQENKPIRRKVKNDHL